MTNSKRKDPLQEVRNPVHERIRYQRRLQEEREAKEEMREALRRVEENRDDSL